MFPVTPIFDLDLDILMATIRISLKSESPLCQTFWFGVAHLRKVNYTVNVFRHIEQMR